MLRSIILNNSTKQQLKTSGSSTAPRASLTKEETERRLRAKRTSKYVEMMTKLDVGGHHSNKQAIDSLIDGIKEELPEISLEELPKGIVAKCYLGDPYEVHTLDILDEIIQHYKKREELPEMLEKARRLAMHPAYAFIEVYLSSLRAVKENGEVIVVKE